MALLIHDVERTPLAVAGSIGLVLGVATIVGAGLSPVGGWIADRLGFCPVLVAAIGGIAISFAAVPLAPNVTWLAVAYSVAIAFQAVVGAMVSDLLATEVPSERRSATLNLIYLPLYLGGIAGPAIGATVVTSGLRTVFFAAAAVLAGSLVVAFAFARRSWRGAVAVASGRGG
jgi:DHA1 family multidrug resistance protein-like MFS transporter